jgi:hypothetical protein
MTENQTVVPFRLMREVFTSEFASQLFPGVGVHDPTVRKVAQLVRHTQGDTLRTTTPSAESSREHCPRPIPATPLKSCPR